MKLVLILYHEKCCSGHLPSGPLETTMHLFVRKNNDLWDSWRGFLCSTEAIITIVLVVTNGDKMGSHYDASKFAVIPKHKMLCEDKSASLRRVLFGVGLLSFLY